MPGTVIEVSATLVASTTRMPRREEGVETRFCSAWLRRAYSGNIQRGVVPQLPGEVPDIALPGQEYQHVAAVAKPAGIDVLDQCGYLRGDTLLGSGLPGVQVMRLHRIGATRHLDHWRIIEVAGKTVDIDGGRGDNQRDRVAAAGRLR